MIDWEIGLALVVTSALAAAFALLLLRPLLVRYALARPNARSSHKVPTPQGGGMAVITVALVGMLAFRQALPLEHRGDLAELLALVVGAGVLAVAGAVDDIRGLGPLPRLGLQLAAVGTVIAVLPGDIRVLPQVGLVVERTLLALGGVWFVNLTNFMDGVDWMTVVEFVPLGAGLVLLGALGALPPRATVVALALTGALLGFAPFNKPVARLFLGDVGSVPIGFLFTWMLVLLAASGHVAAALLLPLYYLADATLTLLRRLGRRERVWEAHRTHFYQRATDLGFSVKQIVARVFGVNLALVALATLTVVEHSLVVALVAMLLGVALVTFLLRGFARGRA